MQHSHRFSIAVTTLLLSGPVFWSTSLYSLALADTPPAVNVPAAKPDEQSKPRQGEIRLSGVIEALNAEDRTFQIKVSSFMLPNGKTSFLRDSKSKTVVLSSQTLIQESKDGNHKGSISDLQVGMAAIVVGPDSGSGKPLTARWVEMARGVGSNAADQPLTLTNLQKARIGFQTKLISKPKSARPVDVPPDAIFKLVAYPAAAGLLPAYLSPNPNDGKKHPAIVWIAGGDCNSIGDVWSPLPKNNDQNATAFRQAGIVMMFPSLRGGNDNPGEKEGFLGEVDDVLAAVKYLEKQEYVDPQRIYLGGHSTGGTLVLLVAECANRFRGIFSFGPVDDVSGYGTDSGFLPFDVSDRKEVELRSPGYWLASIQSPTWVFEGVDRGNIDSLRALAKSSTNPNTHFIEIKEGNHFNILAPTNELIAQKILQDTGDAMNLNLSTEEVNRNFEKQIVQENN